MFIATLKAIGKEFFTISVGLSIVPFLIFLRGYYKWSKQQKGESSNQHGDFISNHVQRRGFQQPSKHGWSDQETWVIWFTNMAEFDPNQTGKNTQLQQQTLKFQVVKLTIWSTGKKPHHPGKPARCLQRNALGSRRCQTTGWDLRKWALKVLGNAWNILELQPSHSVS
jgi:hypothetical protein